MRRSRNRIGNDCAAFQATDGAGLLTCGCEDTVDETAMAATGARGGSLRRQIESWSIHSVLRREPEPQYLISDPNPLRIIAEAFNQFH